MHRSFFYGPAIALFAGLLLSGGAQAATLGVEAEAAVVSDYVYRGYSLSDGKPALQGGVTAALPAGFYAGVWASTIDEYGADAAGKGATVEVDFSVGRAFELAGFDLDLGLAAWTYPRGQGVNYVEVPVSVSRSAGAATWTLGASYAPSQANLGHHDNLYVYGGFAVAPEAWPVAFDAQLGWEDGAFADRKLDWTVGVTAAFRQLRLGLHYADADAPGAGAKVIGSIGVAF